MNKKVIITILILSILIGIGIVSAIPPSDIPWKGPVPVPIPKLPEPAPFPYPKIPPFAPFPVPTATPSPTTPGPTPSPTPPPIEFAKVFVIPDSADPSHTENGTQVLKQTGDTTIDKFAILTGSVDSGFYSVEEMTNYSGIWAPSSEVTTAAAAVLNEAMNSNLITPGERNSYLAMINNNTAKLFWNLNTLPVDSPIGIYVISFRAVSGGNTIAMYNSTFTLENSP